MRAPYLLLAALMFGCGATPATAPSRAVGVPADPAVWLELRPRAFDAALAAFDARIGADPTALGPLGEAWRRTRARFQDQLLTAAPGGEAAPDAWAAWGIDPAVPVRLAVAGADGPTLARALGDRIAGRPAVTAGLAAWRLRIIAGFVDRGRVVDGLDRLAARGGMTVDTGAAPGRPATVAWQATDPAAGLRLTLSFIGDRAVLDVARGDGETTPLPPETDPWPGTPDGTLGLAVSPIGVAALEAGLAARTAFDRTAGIEAARAGPVLTATAEVAARCVDRWRTAAGIVRRLDVAIDAPDGWPMVAGEAELTPEGARRWSAARRPLPLAAIDTLPAAFQVGLAPDAMPAELADWPDEAAACFAGHPALVAGIASGLLPALARPDRLPMPTPMGGWPGAPEGLAAALIGVKRIDGVTVPTMAGLVQVPADHPRSPAPLGPDALQPAEGVFAMPGPVPVTYGDHATGDRRAIVFGLGDGAHTALLARLRPADADEGPVLEARLDPGALAAGLAQAGGTEGVGALATVGQRLGVWRLTATIDRQRLTWRLKARPSTGGELDRPPPAQ